MDTKHETSLGDSPHRGIKYDSGVEKLRCHTNMQLLQLQDRQRYGL